MVFKILMIFLAMLGAIFVVAPFFNYAVFDFQCETSGCSGQICASRKVFASGAYTTCDYKPEYGCNKNCEVRSKKCSFDTDFKDACLECIKDCETRYSLSNQVQAKETCYDVCYKLNVSENTTK